MSELLRRENLEAIADYLTPRIVELLDQATRTCLNCTHFDEPREICNIACKRPPARVIACGCELHEERPPF